MADYFGSDLGENSYAQLGPVAPGGTPKPLGDASGSDNLFGNGGDDALQGYAGSDMLFGGAGNDSLFGNSKPGFEVAGDLGDYLYGGDGNDALFGGDGDDYLESGSGTNTVNGGTGIDTVSYIGSNQSVTANLLAGTVNAGSYATDTITLVENIGGSNFNDTLIGDAGANEIDGFGGNDSLDGGDGQDTIIGQAGRDSLFGGFGDDLLYGGDGDDLLIGGSGFNTIVGGSGVDTVNYQFASVFGNVVVDLQLGQAGFGGFTDAVVSVENVVLGSGNDTVIGDDAANLVNAGFGDDYLEGYLGADTLFGESGNDTLLGAEGNDELFGGQGNDVLGGGRSDDLIDGGDGTDTANFIIGKMAATVDLRITGGQNTGFGMDTLTGIENISSGNGDDVLIGNGFDNVLTSADGNDSLVGLGGNDTLFGGAGDDTLGAGRDDDVIDGGDGTDTAHFLQGNVDVTVNLGLTGQQDTGLGLDILVGIENLSSGDGDDVLTGNALANVLSAAGGNDALFGGNGNDTLLGGAGRDTLNGGNGRDTASYVDALAAVTVSLALTGAQSTGGAGTDTLAKIEDLTGSAFGDVLTGDGDANRIAGGAGNDTIRGSDGADALLGGAGDDLFIIARATHHARGEAIYGGTGTDELRFTTTAASTLQLRADVAGLERVVIGTGSGTSADRSGTTAINVNASLAADALTILGNAGDNRLTGTDFDDALTGGAGDDFLFGGNGDDRLTGGKGLDRLTGGAGADTFVFDVAPNASTNLDVINDFVSGEDRIELARAVMAGLGNVGVLANAAFWSGAGVSTSHDATDRVIYNTLTGALYYDADGTGATLAVQIAQLTPGAALSNTDIFVI